MRPGLTRPGAAGEEEVNLPASQQAAVKEKILHDPWHMPAIGGTDDDVGTLRFEGILSLERIERPGTHDFIHRDELVAAEGGKLLRDITAVARAGKVEDHSRSLPKIE